MRALLLAGVVAFVGSAWLAPARADVITTFDASGTIAGGSTLGGTIAIDTTSGVIEAVALQSHGTISENYTDVTGENYGTNPTELVIFIATPSLSSTGVALFLPVANLVGYSGGDLASGNYIYTEYGDGTLDGTRTSISSAALTPASLPVPEPASMALLGTGLLGMLALRRRRG